MPMCASMPLCRHATVPAVPCVTAMMIDKSVRQAVTRLVPAVPCLKAIIVIGEGPTSCHGAGGAECASYAVSDSSHQCQFQGRQKSRPLHAMVLEVSCVQASCGFGQHLYCAV